MGPLARAANLTLCCIEWGEPPCVAECRPWGEGLVS